MAEFDYTQEERNLRLETPLGPDVLLPASVVGEEYVSGLFRFDLKCFSRKPDADFDAIVGKNVTLALETPEGPRYFNAVVRRFRQASTSLDLTEYHLELVPWFWLLTRVADCRIFQNKKVPDIISAIFDDLEFQDYRLDLEGKYEPVEYCVQYRETSFDFVCRLLEREGIWYYFEHENGKHTLVLADAPGRVKDGPLRTDARYNAKRNAAHEEEYVFSVQQMQQVHTTNLALRDFNFETPNDTVSGAREESEGYGPLEIYDYPGLFDKSGDGGRYAGVRLEEQLALEKVLQCASNCRGLMPGFKFELKEHPRKDFNQSLLVLRVRHEAHEEGGFQAGRETESEYSYQNHFDAIPASQAYRPPRTTPSPVIHGAQTAVVTGPSGEEIHTDKYGRVKVHFHWDRQQPLDDKSSCWVRVSQGWAGKNWGTVMLPRVGMEVIVDFLEGDPDRPLVTGCVYNAEAMPPYALPANKTISGVKSRSTKDAGSEDLNAIRFEDKKGNEQLFIQAQRNQDIRVKNDRYEHIGHDRHLIVKNNRTEFIENERHEKVAADHVEEIGGDRHLMVKGKEAEAIGKNRSLTVKGDLIEVVKKNHSEEVTNDFYLKADNICIEAKTNLTVKVGQSFLAIESGGIKIGTTGKIILDAKQSIEQKALQDVKIEGLANVSVKGTGGLKLESTAITDLKGAAMVKVAGGMVKLN